MRWPLALILTSHEAVFQRDALAALGDLHRSVGRAEKFVLRVDHGVAARRDVHARQRCRRAAKRSRGGAGRGYLTRPPAFENCARIDERIPASRRRNRAPTRRGAYRLVVAIAVLVNPVNRRAGDDVVELIEENELPGAIKSEAVGVRALFAEAGDVIDGALGVERRLPWRFGTSAEADRRRRTRRRGAENSDLRLPRLLLAWLV